MTALDLRERLEKTKTTGGGEVGSTIGSAGTSAQKQDGNKTFLRRTGSDLTEQDAFFFKPPIIVRPST